MKVNITVKDINDNKPELAVDEVFLCESDVAGTVIKACYDQTRFVRVQTFVLTCVEGVLMQQSNKPLIITRCQLCHHFPSCCVIHKNSFRQGRL